jgi:CDP-diacylglycerol--serine O-phosphatidyltransferase
MNIKKHIPNAITCGNLLSGCLSILFIASGMPVKAAFMILVAGLFDYLDGFAARMLNEHSPIGRDLDSLSDVVSFGVAPGLIMSYMMNNGLDMPQLRIYDVDLMPCLGFMLPVFAAIRLARFNIDHSQDVVFRGLPAPAMAVFVAGIPMALSQVGHLLDGAFGFWACLGVTILLSFMMVSNLRFFSFKMKTLAWKGNQVRWIFIAITVLGVIIFKLVSLPFIMIIYMLLSIFFAGKTVEE